jgi:UDP-N-acetylglucosamine/UDP-N-acetylgalactosamine diphosphorylase
VLTSPQNHQETKAFFARGPTGCRVHFFEQPMLPLFNESLRWFWASPGRIAEGPDGNGSVFAAFAKSGLLNQFLQMGVEAVKIIPVDNPLAGNCPNFSPLGDLCIKCIQLNDPQEPMGRLVCQGGKMAVAEFAELFPEQRQRFCLANTGLLTIDLHLIQELAKQKFPLHWAWKETDCWENGQMNRKFAWKRERFIVDALAFAKKPCAILALRERCYAPLKEKNSIPVIESLLNRGK